MRTSDAVRFIAVHSSLPKTAIRQPNLLVSELSGAWTNGLRASRLPLYRPGRPLICEGQHMAAKAQDRYARILPLPCKCHGECLLRRGRITQPEALRIPAAD